MSKTAPHWLKQSLRELVILVIGILLSLWVSSLFQNAQDHKREQTYLERLQQDLTKDLEQLNSQMKQRQGQVEASQSMLRTLNGNQEQQRSAMVGGFQQLLWTARFSSNDATFRSLESTGDLRLIRNDSIVSSVMDLYRRHYQALQDNNNDVTKYRDNYLLAYTTENVNFRKAFNPTLGSPTPDNLDQLYNHLVYENITLQSTVNAYKRSIKYAEQLKRLIDRELGSEH
ncbi:MAG: DUF6090 family protein [Bacteroidota bacterium]